MDSDLSNMDATKSFLMKGRPAQIVLNRPAPANTEGPSCGHFIWQKAALPGPEVAKLLSNLGAFGPGRGPFFWLGALEDEHLEGVSIPFDTQLYVLRRVGEVYGLMKVYGLMEVYDLEEGGRRVWGEVGVWSPASGQLKVPTMDLWARRGDLAGKTFRAAILPYGDFLRINDQVLESWHGMVPDIYRALARRMNFTYSLDLSRDGKWGGRNRVGDIKHFPVFYTILFRKQGSGTV